MQYSIKVGMFSRIDPVVDEAGKAVLDEAGQPKTKESKWSAKYLVATQLCAADNWNPDWRFNIASHPDNWHTVTTSLSINEIKAIPMIEGVKAC